MTRVHFLPSPCKQDTKLLKIFCNFYDDRNWIFGFFIMYVYMAPSQSCVSILSLLHRTPSLPKSLLISFEKESKTSKNIHLYSTFMASCRIQVLKAPSTSKQQLLIKSCLEKIISDSLILRPHLQLQENLLFFSYYS